MSTPIIAADTNLLLHPTPRRYITVLEGLRARRVVVLPTVDREARPLLRAQAIVDVRKKERRNPRTDRKAISEEARKAAQEAVKEAESKAAQNARWWWANERTRNTSGYTFVPDLGEEHYEHWMTMTPDHAFKERNDWLIYAEAMAHNVNVLASQNRRTIDVDEINDYFMAQGKGSAPVTVRSLWEHTRAVARSEGRSKEDVALEAVLCAVIPEQWQETSEDVVHAVRSAKHFKNSLSRQGSRSRGEEELDDAPAVDDFLAAAVHRAIEALDATAALEKLRAAYAIRPHAARQSEARYHRAARQGKRRREGRGIGE